MDVLMEPTGPRTCISVTGSLQFVWAMTLKLRATPISAARQAFSGYSPIMEGLKVTNELKEIMLFDKNFLGKHT